jgi:hypothetical protein
MSSNWQWFSESLQVEAQLRVTFRKHEASEMSPSAAEQDKQEFRYSNANEDVWQCGC